MSDTSSPSLRPRELLTPASVLIALLLAALFWWTFSWMVFRWDQAGSYYSHGWLILPVSVYLLYRRRSELAACPRQFCARGLYLLVPSLLLQFVATALQVGFLSGFALVGVLAGLVLTLLGRRFLRLTWFPILFLLFMVPIPDEFIKILSFKLKMVSAGVAVQVTEFFGLDAVPKSVDGANSNIIIVPTGELVVDDVCSGLKYIISLLAFGAIYGHISSVKPWQKCCLFVLSLPIAFFANVGRVILMVVVGCTRGVGAVGAWYFHDLFGFVLFAVAFTLLFLAESLMLLKFRRSLAAPSPVAAPPPPAGGSAPRGKTVPVAVILCMTVAALLANLARPRGVTSPSDILDAVPRTIGVWKGFDYPVDEHTIQVLGTPNVLSRRYLSDKGDAVFVTVILAQQTRKRTHSPEQCMVGGGLVKEAACDRALALQLPDGNGFRIHEILLRSPNGHVISWYFYKSGNRYYTSYWAHHVALTFRKLHDPSAADILVRIDTNTPSDGVEEGRAKLATFFAHAMPQILDTLP